MLKIEWHYFGKVLVLEFLGWKSPKMGPEYGSLSWWNRMEYVSNFFAWSYISIKTWNCFEQFFFFLEKSSLWFLAVILIIDNNSREFRWVSLIIFWKELLCIRFLALKQIGYSVVSQMKISLAFCMEGPLSCCTCCLKVFGKTVSQE